MRRSHLVALMLAAVLPPGRSSAADYVFDPDAPPPPPPRPRPPMPPPPRVVVDELRPARRARPAGPPPTDRLEERRRRKAEAKLQHDRARRGRR